MGLKLSISNIAWDNCDDQSVYVILQKLGYHGLEIAPTKLFPIKPYEHLNEAEKFSKELKRQYGLQICSIQSIWYGKSENIFETPRDREVLSTYTKEAILFAEKIGAHNLVFGCPKNRCIKKEKDYGIAVDFFRSLGEFASEHNTVLALEANPVIYNTNFINTTEEALQLIKEVDSDGFSLNLDLGTIIYNSESFSVSRENIKFINHVHISEPYLKQVIPRSISKELIIELIQYNYQGYVSIEMEKQEQLSNIIEVLEYLNKCCEI